MADRFLAKKSPARAVPTPRDAREEKWRNAVSLMEKFPVLADDLRAMVKQDMANFLGFAAAPATSVPTLSPMDIKTSPTFEKYSGADAELDLDVKPREMKPVSCVELQTVSSPLQPPRSTHRDLKKPTPLKPTRIFTAEEVGRLKEVFQLHPYLDYTTLEGLREELGIPKPINRKSCAVIRWFKLERRRMHVPKKGALPTSFSAQAVVVLRRVFNDTPYLTKEKLAELRRELGIPTPKRRLGCKIQRWFCTERCSYFDEGRPLPNGYTRWDPETQAPGRTYDDAPLDLDDHDAESGDSDADVHDRAAAQRGMRKRRAESEVEGDEDDNESSHSQGSPSKRKRR